MYAVRWLAGASRASRLVLARPRSAPTAIARIDTENVHVRYVTLDLATSTYVDLLYRYRYRIGKIRIPLSLLFPLCFLLFLLVSTGTMVHSINYLDKSANVSDLNGLRSYQVMACT